MKIKKHGQYWTVYDDNSELICIAVYKKGSIEVVRRLSPNLSTYHGGAQHV